MAALHAANDSGTITEPPVALSALARYAPRGTISAGPWCADPRLTIEAVGLVFCAVGQVDAVIRELVGCAGGAGCDSDAKGGHNDGLHEDDTGKRFRQLHTKLQV